MNYWEWLLVRGENGPGYKRFVNGWLVVQIGFGACLAFVVKKDLATVANGVLLPLVGGLVGLCFAWGGNANALMQTDEFEQFAAYRKGGLKEYVFVYATAILVVLVTLCVWGVAGMGVFDDYLKAEYSIAYFVSKVVLFSLLGICIRECWHVVLAVQLTLLARSEIRQQRKPRSLEE